MLASRSTTSWSNETRSSADAGRTSPSVVHERAHGRVHGRRARHSAAFYKVLDKLREECEGLMARGITGEGADIRVSMFDVMAEWLTVPLMHQEGGKPPKRIGLAHPSVAPYGVFTTKEGTPVLISIQSEREWAKFCQEFLRQPEAITDPRFCTNVARVENRAETDALVGGTFGELDVPQSVERLTAADVAFASCAIVATASSRVRLSSRLPPRLSLRWRVPSVDAILLERDRLQAL